MAVPGHRIVTFFICQLSFILLTLHFSCSDNSPKINENTLAVVGNRTIDIECFKKRYQDFNSRTGADDNGQARRSILKNIINEELLINEARKKEYDKDLEGQHEWERIRIQQLLNAYHKRMISDKVKVEDEELQQLFIRLNTKIKARHLYAPTYEKAVSLYQSLRQGRSFFELAQDVFKDPVLRNSGGELGYFSVDEMDPALEEAAYDLEVGEISKPIHTNDGYSIIKVEDRKVKPLLTEYEYAKHRSQLLAYWKKRKNEKLTQQYVSSLRGSLNIKFNESVLRKLFLALNNEPENNLFKEEKISSSGINEIKNDELVRSDIGVWDIEEFRRNIRYTSEKQRSWIRSEESLKDFISGLIIRTWMLSEARSQNLDKTQDYRDKVNYDFDTYLLERIQKDIFEDITIPEDSLLSYYDQDPKRFADPPRVNLREIVLDNADDTVFIKSQLNKGSSFPELAKRFSVRRWSAENNGELGYLTPSDLGQWSSLAFSIDVGKWIGPIRMDSYHVFLQCVDKSPSQLRTFEEARNDVTEALRTMWWEREKSKKLMEIQKRVSVQSFPEKLLSIRPN
jgi:parvulin-like peptidyl-prolyl isomerase